MEANTNPDLEKGFCTTGTKIDIPEQLQLLGVTPENPTIHGHVINKLFNMIFENLNHQKKKGISFWEPDEEYEATANNIDICRRNNKIYFCKQSHNDTGTAPKDPATNPDYWTVFYDLDKPLESTYALINHNHDTTYAQLGGLDTQTFLVKAGTTAKSAVNKEQMEIAVESVTEEDFIPNDLRAKTALNASGLAPIYACRAWVNFNGIGAVSINGSGNVSSITDNGTGDYDVNLITAMPDKNYSINASICRGGAGQVSNMIAVGGALPLTNITTTGFQLLTGNGVNLGDFDPADLDYISATVFR